MNLSVKIEVFQEGDVYVALSPELSISSFGETIEEAKVSVGEAIEAFIEECERMGTLEDVLEESGFSQSKHIWVHRKPILEEALLVAR
jgi:predicted RNase H-like HicB family nuclease